MPTTAKDDKTQGDKVVKMREAGKNWAEISETLSIRPGLAMYLFEKATVTSKNKIKGKDEAELKKNIAAARDNQNLSWGTISARSGKSEGYCRSAYQEITGVESRGTRIGKGGRFPSENGAAPAKKAAKTVKAPKASKAVKKAAKAAPVKKAAKKAVVAKKAVKAAKRVAAEV